MNAKTLTLINPRPRRRKRAKATKRRARRNPRRKMTAKQLKYFGPRRKRVTRRARRNPTRRRSAARRKTSRRSYRPAARRRTYRRNPVLRRNPRRRSYRRRARRNPISLGGYFTKQFVLMAVGGVAAPMLNNAILNSSAVQKLNLPGLGNNVGDAVYRFMIPFGASAVLNRFGGKSTKAFARGLVLGALIQSLGALVGIVNTKMRSVAGTSAYPGRVRGMREYFPAMFANQRAPRRIASPVAPVAATPGYSAHRMRGVGGPFTGERAFPSDD